MSSEAEAPPAPPGSAERLEEVVSVLTAAIGDGLVVSALAGPEATVRVAAASWRTAAEALRDRLDMDYFCFLSGIDWKDDVDLAGEKVWDPDAPSGADGIADGTDSTADGTDAPDAADAAADAADGTGAPDGTASARETSPVPEATPAQPASNAPYPTGVAGGQTRFQLLARLYSTRHHYGVTLKADLDEDDPRADSWVGVYRGADWHERETWEMFGFEFDGHPGLRHLYLPGEFEGHPLRKDFPMLAREVKPWPGLVDVEPMPGEPDAEASEGAEGAEPA